MKEFKISLPIKLPLHMFKHRGYSYTSYCNNWKSGRHHSTDVGSVGCNNTVILNVLHWTFEPYALLSSLQRTCLYRVKHIVLPLRG